MREIIVQHVVIWDLRLKVSPHRRRNVMEHFEMSIIRDICRAMSETQDHMHLSFLQYLLDGEIHKVFEDYQYFERPPLVGSSST